MNGSPKSLFAAIDAIDFYSSLSGLKVNICKTKIIWIGSKLFMIRYTIIQDESWIGAQQHSILSAFIFK